MFCLDRLFLCAWNWQVGRLNMAKHKDGVRWCSTLGRCGGEMHSCFACVNLTLRSGSVSPAPGTKVSESRGQRFLNSTAWNVNPTKYRGIGLNRTWGLSRTQTTDWGVTILWCRKRNIYRSIWNTQNQQRINIFWNLSQGCFPWQWFSQVSVLFLPTSMACKTCTLQRGLAECTGHSATHWTASY